MQRTFLLSRSPTRASSVEKREWRVTFSRPFSVTLVHSSKTSQRS